MTNLMKSTVQLTEDKFKEVFVNEDFRNQVAFAHVHADKHGNFKYRATCSYPIKYIVNDEQIKVAKELKEKAKAETLKTNKNKLLFVGMGTTYKPRYNDDVCNHRIRTEFLNRNGKKYFIEFGTGRGEDLRIDHAIDRDLQDRLKDDFHRQGEFYNFKGLERDTPSLKYTLTNILKIVNEYFDCKFKEVVIDNYNISCNGVICESPKN